MQTILLVPLLPDGVLQLGSLEMVRFSWISFVYCCGSVINIILTPRSCKELCSSSFCTGQVRRKCLGKVIVLALLLAVLLERNRFERCEEECGIIWDRGDIDRSFGFITKRNLRLDFFPSCEVLGFSFVVFHVWFVGRKFFPCYTST